MTDWNLDDIEGLPTDPVELRAWVGKVRALWRNWADCGPHPTPEAGFKKAAGYMDELRKHLGMPTADEAIAAMRAASAGIPVMGEPDDHPKTKIAGTFVLTIEAVRAAKFARISEKGGKITSRSNACDRLTMVKDGERYTFWVDAGRLGDREFPTVGEAVDWINAMPGGK